MQPDRLQHHVPIGRPLPLGVVADGDRLVGSCLAPRHDTEPRAIPFRRKSARTAKSIQVSLIIDTKLRPPPTCQPAEGGPGTTARFRDFASARRRNDRERGNPMRGIRSEEHTSELQSLMRISYAVFCLKKTKN